MRSLKTKVSITLDADVIDEIRKLAEEDDRSFSQYINLALKEYLREMKSKTIICMSDNSCLVSFFCMIEIAGMKEVFVW